MNFDFTTLEGLKASSISIDKPIATYICLPELDPEERTNTFDPTLDLEEVHHCYRELYGIIAFVDEEEIMYAIPACRVVRTMLESNRFVLDQYLHVPFIHYDVPLLEMDKWEELLAWRTEQLKSEGTA